MKYPYRVLLNTLGGRGPHLWLACTPPELKDTLIAVTLRPITDCLRVCFIGCAGQGAKIATRASIGYCGLRWVLKPAMIEALPLRALHEPLQDGEPIAASRFLPVRCKHPSHIFRP